MQRKEILEELEDQESKERKVSKEHVAIPT